MGKADQQTESYGTMAQVTAHKLLWEHQRQDNAVDVGVEWGLWSVKTRAVESSDRRAPVKGGTGEKKTMSIPEKRNTSRLALRHMGAFWNE